MSFYGADTAQLRGLSTSMTLAGNSLRLRRDYLGARIASIDSIWQGPDADEFKEKWRRLDSTFETAQEKVTRAGQELDRQAEEQDEASDRSLLDKIVAALPLVKDLIKAGRSISKIITNPIKMIKEFKHYKNLKAYWDKRKLIAKTVPGMENATKNLWKAILNQRSGAGTGWAKLGEKLGGQLGKLAENIPGASWLSKHGGKWLGSKVDVLAKGMGNNSLLKFGSKHLGKVLPALDIGLGINQMITSKDTFSKITGGMSTLGGTLTLVAPFTGPAAPIVAGIGLGVGVVGAGLDLGKMAWDNREKIGKAIGTGAKAVGDFAGKVGKGIGDGFRKLGSIFG